MQNLNQQYAYQKQALAGREKEMQEQINQSGLDPIQFVMQLAKQNNVPINENAILNMCQQMRSMTPKK